MQFLGQQQRERITHDRRRSVGTKYDMRSISIDVHLTVYADYTFQLSGIP